ncbi:(2Fe-2S) ferredoxin domain-containing protein [Turicibacter bilis]|jgi:NADH:ubiquinone oxidoreductase subunit E|uniref:(2Fe-2S) ferredoxin domain-containing protein n=1 Tax=Turicibacter bilis TaxID=2735723 RepID=A0ABY5JJD2_9FIRM|nr:MULTISPECIES: (2Fe-2S) ferredoxin domain-containing protein [Turicibacter]MDD5985899.1 (2Fe-2S) ferredoxin domain-containing protein [Turicibacter sp.]CUN44800.1 NADH:ubiquinone oxidoreductase 24 kD subunit [Turicibacter sanguinis]AMC07818.1 NADH dehydrogenase [Turicibacter sp. H121]MBS3201120.1 (2Fe-2S) ferredoxin domain-containing protein [Turicibacter bilis]MBS3202271.1 (2Fe-2S) ferredoxin domain-containing protein [Turicibacter bilis]
MKSIKICVGSSCHLKGSYEVIQLLQQLIKSAGLETCIELRAAFCLGHCTEAVSLVLPTGEVIGVSPDQVQHIFKSVILPLVMEEE